MLVARTMSLLLTPQEVFGDPEVLRRLAASGRDRAAARPVQAAAAPPLTREDLLAAGR